MTKDKVLSVRFSPSEYALLEKAAKDKKISPSTLVRSLSLTAIEHNFDIPSFVSPSPNFDKLSFDARQLILSPFDLAIVFFLRQGLTVQQAENAFLLSQALAGESLANSALNPSELKDKVNVFYKNQIEQLTSELSSIE